MVSMAWFSRAVSSVAWLAVRKTVSQRASYVTRTQALFLKDRTFHGAISGPEVETAAVPQSVPLSRLADNFLAATSSVYIEDLQRAWEADPNGVDESWDNFFRNFADQGDIAPGVSGQTIQESMRLLLLVRAYQANGHRKAKLDPLELGERKIHDDLDPAFHGFTEADLDREFFLGEWKISDFLSDNRLVMTLRSILTKLEQVLGLRVFPETPF